MTSVLLTLSTCPDQHTADQIATCLVSEGLAACVNILPGARSVYLWHDRVTQDQEHLLLIKTHQSRFAALRERLVELHPYELPEVIAVPVTDGLTAYIKWIEECTVHSSE